MPEGESNKERRFIRRYDLDRTTAFSDGVFAIAVTLLILNVELPDIPDGKHDELAHELGQLLPQMLCYALSFAVIARYWVLHHGFFGDLREVDGRLTVMNLVYLGMVAFVPFPTSVLGNYGDQATAVTLYAASVGLVALLGNVMTVYAHDHRLFKPDSMLGQATRREILLNLGIPGVFFLSIPVAWLISPAAGQILWVLLLVQIGPMIRRKAFEHR